MQGTDIEIRSVYGGRQGERQAQPPERAELYDLLKTEVGRCGNWNVLVANLNRQGVEVRFKHKGQTNEVQGVVFTINGYHFNGSKVDRRFSYSKIDAVLLRNRYEEHTRRMPRSTETTIPNVASETTHGEFFSGSLGLFTPNTNNVPEEKDSYDSYLRNRKKKKKHRKINW